MSDYKRRSYNDRDTYGGDNDRGFKHESAPEDVPPNSRLFIIGGKTLSEEDFKDAFNHFGDIERIDVKRQKGISYLKFSKTSEAAEALEEMNGKSIGSDPRPLKIVIASSRSQGNSRDDVTALRIFVVIPKSFDEEELKNRFSEFGPIEYVSVVKDKQTNEKRGFGYVKYFRFSHAAKAYEGCDPSFKPKFADPRPPRDDRGSERSFGGSIGGYGGMSQGFGSEHSYGGGRQQQMPSFDPVMANPSGTCKLAIMANPILSQEKLWKLFDVIPGLEFCELNQPDMSGERAYGTVMYDNPKSAAYAIEKLHGFDYPLGSRIMIKLDDSAPPRGFGGGGQRGSFGSGSSMGGGGGGGGVSSSNPNMPSDIKNLMSTIQHATQMLQASGYGPSVGMGSGVPNNLDPSMFSGELPPPQPLASSGTQCEERLFFVCKNSRDNPPPHILTDVFSRFGNLIEAYLMKGKKCGYAKYASKESAQRAIMGLNEQTLMGSYLKVLVAEESSADRAKRPRMDEY
jgi:RNA recognition motif-containing protein